MFLEPVATLIQDARRRSADNALWNGKREIYFKVSRLRYLATRGSMALAVRRCTETSWNRLGVSFWSSALQRRACQAGRLGAEMRRRNFTDQKNRITMIASFNSHCIFTEETPPTRLSAGGRGCITAKQCPCILCWTSTRRRRVLTCARMCVRRAPWRICTRRSTARHAACTHVSEAAFIVRLPFLGDARETESESTRWRDSFDHRGVRQGQDETHRKGCEHTQFVVVVCLTVFTAPVRLHRVTLADVRRLFCARPDEVLEYDG